MKFTLLIILFLAVTTISTRRHHRRHHQDEGEEGDDAGVSRDTLMEFRILGAGTFSVADQPEADEEGERDYENFDADYAQFPNYCKQQLDEHQFMALTTKAQTYLDCWYDAVEVEALGGCQEALAGCAAALEEFELESEDDGEEEGDEEVEEEEGEEEEECEEMDEEGECLDESESSADEALDQDELFVHEEVPHLNPVQVTCFYSVITQNLENDDNALAGEEALEEGSEAIIFKEVTFHQNLRTSVSWLEFWLYMCNGDEFIHEAFDENPLLESTEKAIELYEELADDGEEEEERRKVMRHGKKSLKHKKSHKRLHRRAHRRLHRQ